MPEIADVVARLARGDTTPSHVVEAALSALESAQTGTNAVTQVLARQARSRAKAIDKQPASGPLHGVPVAVKDAFDVAGAPTTACRAAFGSRIAARHAAAVEALEAAGAIVVAKTNQHELMAGATGAISSFGPVRNPWDFHRIAGGSSSGSAAVVAAGAVPLALGSDTGGSIRIPASFCGLTGLKPTHGTVSLRGVLPMGPRLDTAGPLATSARDCAVTYRVLHQLDRAARHAPVTAPSPSHGLPHWLRIGLPRSYFTLVHDDVRAAVEGAATLLEDLGAHVDWVDGPELDDGWEGFKHVWADVANNYRDLWDHHDVHPDVASLIDFGRSMTDVEYAGRWRGRSARASSEPSPQST